jgi:hypothetical protein
MMSKSHQAATGGRAEGSQNPAVIVPGATTGRGFVVDSHRSDPPPFFSAEHDETQVHHEYHQDTDDPEWDFLLGGCAELVAAGWANQQGRDRCDFYHEVRAAGAAAAQ